MRRRIPATIALVLTVVLAGCAGGIGGGSSTDATTTASTTTTSAPTESATDTASPTTATTVTAEPTATATKTYVAPITPNRPTETADEEGNRIKSGSFINTVPAENGSGYTDFDVQIRANTSMHNVDPPEHGDVEGEPFALVIVNGELVERSPYFEMRDDGTFNVSVHPDGLRHAGVEPGTLEVKVLLMDQDGAHDDVYGTWSGTIEYAGYAGAA